MSATIHTLPSHPGTDADCSLLAPVPLPPKATASRWEVGANGKPYRRLSTGAVQYLDGSIDFGAASAGPEAVGLDLIAAIGKATDAPALCAALRDFAGALHVDRTLAGLATDGDARLAAAVITDAVCAGADSVGTLRIRAAMFRARCWDCADPQSLALALDGAATVLDAL